MKSPFGVIEAVAVEDPDEAAWSELHADERAFATAMTATRAREWIAGRRALRRALHVVSGQRLDGALLVDDRGAPLVPAAWVGSLSHKRDLAVGLASAAAGWTVGIDLERDREQRIDISRKVFTAAESEAASALVRREFDRAVMVAFCIKEAIYKAIDPHLRRYVGFDEVAVWPQHDGRVIVEPVIDWGLEVEASWWREAANIVATARARPNS